MITKTPDLTKGPAQEATAAGDNVTIAAPIGGSPGMHFSLMLIQDGVGGRSFLFDPIYYGEDPTAFIPTANSETRVRCVIKGNGTISMAVDYTGVLLP